MVIVINTTAQTSDLFVLSDQNVLINYSVANNVKSVVDFLL